MSLVDLFLGYNDPSMKNRGARYLFEGQIISVNPKKFPDFVKFVSKQKKTFVRSCGENNGKRSLTIDIRLKWEKYGNFTERFINFCISTVSSIIENMIVLNKDDLKCVTAIHSSELNGFVERELCITYPLISINRSSHVEVQKECKRILLNCNPFSYLDNCPTQFSVASIVPVGMINYRRMYHPKDSLIKAYDITKSDKISSCEIPISEVFDINNHGYVKSRKVDPSELKGVNTDPFIFDFYATMHGRKTMNDDYYHISENVFDSSYVSDKRIICEQLLELISPIRILVELYLIRVVYAVKVVFGGDETGYVMIIKKVKSVCQGIGDDSLPTHLKNKFKSVKFMYYNMDIGDYPYSIKSLEWYAKEDSPSAYNIWKNGRIYDLIDKISVVSTDAAIGRLFIEVYGLIVLNTIRGKGVEWMIYNGVWRISNSVEIEQLFHRLPSVVDNYIEILVDYSERLDDKDSYSKQQKIEKRITGATTVKFGLETSAFINKGMKWITGELFARVSEFMDRDPGTTRTKTYTIDCSIVTGDCLFREGCPEDFITVSTGSRYRDEYSWDHPDVHEAITYIKQLHDPTLSTNTYKKLLACHFISGNPLKAILILLGEHGDNSKTTLLTIMKAAFSGIVSSFDHTILTYEKADRSGPNPAVVAWTKRRALYCCELPDGAIIKAGNLKTFVGLDFHEERECYSNDMVEVKTNKLAIIASNSIPLIDIPTGPAVRRITLIEYIARYTSYAPKDPELQKADNHYPADPNFVETAPNRLKDAFVWIGVESFHMLAKEGISIAENEVTKKFKKECNIMRTFKKQHLENKLNEDGEIDQELRIKCVDVMNIYKSWLTLQGYYNRKVSINTFSKAMSKELNCEPVKGFWYGIELVNIDGLYTE